jgi:hypothetical protein
LPNLLHSFDQLMKLNVNRITMSDLDLALKAS